ncbi:hypothetical protein [Nocardioides montaniterrae]
MIDPRDPLPGLDPYPRELIDAFGLHQERADLLEEIVSTPSPARQPSPTRTRVLLALGVAAALAIIGGGAWAITSGDHARDDTNVAAAPTTSTTPSATPTAGRDVRRAGVTVATRQCNGALGSRRDQLDHALRSLSRLRVSVAKLPHGARVYTMRTKGGRRQLVAVDGACRIRYLRSLTSVRGH